jgi:hypothetical protein
MPCHESKSLSCDTDSSFASVTNRVHARPAGSLVRVVLAVILERGPLIDIALDVPGIVDVTDYRGDCQMHSVWSDWFDTIAQMAKGAMARGRNRIAVTDHSKGVAIAEGMSIEAMRRQHDGICHGCSYSCYAVPVRSRYSLAARGSPVLCGLPPHSSSVSMSNRPHLVITAARPSDTLLTHLRPFE